MEVNPYLEQELVVRCANDHDIPVEVTGDGLGIVPSACSELGQEGIEILARCRNGLNIPVALDGPYGGYTRVQMRRLYDHLVWVRECLAKAGYAQADPPGFEVWLEDQMWDPYVANNEPDITAGDRPALIRQCTPYLGARPEG